MRLTTKQEAAKHIQNLGILEFSHLSEGIAMFQSIERLQDGNIFRTEVYFFIEQDAVFFRLDRMEDFLSGLRVFEIIERSRTIEETIYHRKYDE
tara:strand:+ start:2190 stop:2471 length:282 start_codon:yes stop_codon:yes gene_type:complete